MHTSHHPVGAGATWGMFWGLLFGLLFFIPFFGLAIGAGMGALMGKITKSGIDREFQDQVRGMLQPGTSALFLMVEKVTPDKAVEAHEQVRRHGAQVLAVQGRRAGPPGRPARRHRTERLTGTAGPGAHAQVGHGQPGSLVSALFARDRFARVEDLGEKEAALVEKPGPFSRKIILSRTGQDVTPLRQRAARQTTAG